MPTDEERKKRRYGEQKMMTPDQELKRIDDTEKRKAKEPAYGFEGMTAGEIEEEGNVRKSKVRELERTKARASKDEED